MSTEREQTIVPLLAGGTAGVAVDLILFPLDTIKTRLQSSKGFFKSGGFQNIYRGISSTALGSFPTASLFFFSYETTKRLCVPYLGQSPTVHMTAACVGEMVGCIVRVPAEVVKQRAQAIKGLNSRTALLKTLREEGFFGLYRGYLNTVARDIPFSLIQFTCWEFFKIKLKNHQSSEVLPWQSAILGSISGAIAGATTTPLDVVKSRIMLAERRDSVLKSNLLEVLTTVAKQEGVRGLFSGLIPRVAWLSIGGLVFLGTYEKVKQSLLNIYE